MHGPQPCRSTFTLGCMKAVCATHFLFHSSLIFQITPNSWCIFYPFWHCPIPTRLPSFLTSLTMRGQHSNVAYVKAKREKPAHVQVRIAYQLTPIGQSDTGILSHICICTQNKCEWALLACLYHRRNVHVGKASDINSIKRNRSISISIDEWKRWDFM